MTFLVDTSVLSETRKRQPAAGVVAWLRATPSDRLYLSALTLGEIEQGIAKIRARGDGPQATAFDRWVQSLETGFEGRILPVTRSFVTEIIRKLGTSLPRYCPVTVWALCPF